MPTYQYACTECGHQLEAVQSFTDEPLTECPACEGRLRKLFNSVGIVFKGSGFYRTDSRANGSEGGTGGSAAAKSDSAKGTSGGSGGGDSNSSSSSGGGSGSTSSGGSGDSGGGSGSANGSTSSNGSAGKSKASTSSSSSSTS
ncbi:FmdB family zinc ribbon protein [Plantactinospora solaniradicis]|uniref:FmdB family zinc ribbon protein n=1 Tax=Plantactinospora solaniradicis TaxID=1723736 RepID=A0ABW1K2E9_9ACTN